MQPVTIINPDLREVYTDQKNALRSRNIAELLQYEKLQTEHYLSRTSDPEAIAAERLLHNNNENERLKLGKLNQ